MALREYEYGGLTYQFDDQDVPEGAVEVKQIVPQNKAYTPANKGVEDVSSKPRGGRQRKPAN